MISLMFGGRRRIDVTIAASTSNVNVFTLAGSPLDPVDVYVIVNAAVHVHSASVLTPSMTTGTGWDVSSKAYLTNNGHIHGRGGNGGAGGLGGSNGQAGQLASDALEITLPIEITNAAGEIFGGGGGGGGGAGNAVGLGQADGGGGGGGQGDTSTGGANGSSAATGGNDAGPGTRALPTIDPFYGTSGGRGGNGGAWGQDGINGVSAGAYSGGVGGAAGKAVKTNGNAVTWVSGNDSTHVKGVVG